jgi:hypothetical protein
VRSPPHQRLITARDTVRDLDEAAREATRRVPRPRTDVQPTRVARRDRRAGARLAVSYAMDLSMIFEGVLVQDERARVVSLSEAGAFVVAQANPRVGQQALLRFACADGIGVAAGAVVRAQDGRGFAIAFTDANDAFRRFLAARRRQPATCAAGVLDLV